MKILLTGMTSSQIHEETKRQGMTLTGAMAQCLRDMGHEVETRAFGAGEMYENGKYDFVWVGLGPIKGLGTAYMYGALNAIWLHSYPGAERVGVYLDDTNSRKIGNEFRAVMRKPSDLVKPFFSYKRGWERAREPDVFEILMKTVTMLGGRPDIAGIKHPPIFVPAWHYDLAFGSATLVSPAAAENLFTTDPSVYFDVELERYKAETEYWATMWNPESLDITNMGTRLWEVEPISRLSWGPLSGASGLLVPAATWVPELHIASGMGIPVACDWRLMGPLFGEHFEHLPANIEVMTEREREFVATAQYEALLEQSTTKEKMMEALASAMERTSR